MTLDSFMTEEIFRPGTSSESQKINFAYCVTKSGTLDSNKTKNLVIPEEYPDLSTYIYCGYHEVEPQRCPACNAILKVLSFRKGWPTNQIACSKECLAAMKDVVVERREKTMTERYGARNASLSPELVEKRRQTYIERFGAESHLSNKEIREKIKATNQEKYGSDSPGSDPKIRERMKATNLERYGVENPMASKEMQKKAIATKRKKYGWVEKPERPQYPIPYKVLLKHEHMLLLNDKERLFRAYEENGLYGLAEELGCSKAVVKRYLDIHKYTANKRQLSSLEKRIIWYLNKIEVPFVLHDRGILEGKEIDILIPDHNLGIEANGNYFHSYNPHSTIKGISDKNHARDKFFLANDKGIRLLQFREDQILDKFEIIKSMILSRVGKAIKIPARKTRIVNLSVDDAAEFCKANHLNGYASATHKLGLVFDERLVSVMTFVKNRFAKKDEWEIVRFCTLHGHVVVGGGSKLLKYFSENVSPNIITYSDCMVGNGESYTAMGFFKKEYVEPGYHWLSPECIVHSRLEFQRHKLNEIFGQEYPQHMTEEEIMFSQGFRKMFNAGNYKFSQFCPE